MQTPCVLAHAPAAIGSLASAVMLRRGLADNRATDVLQQLRLNAQPGQQYEADLDDAPITTDPVVRLIAFYLPQFHPIPENDEWWGKGFTEWTNVTKAVPRFPGHYQPRLPGELGFYDLRVPDILRKQANLAKRYGIGGFCFHHYWFGGRRLLEHPLDTLLNHPDIDLPFCINWANENWSRRWDGRDHDTLMAQQHSPEDDIAFAVSLEPLFRDPRYIRIDGRPLLMLYRPSLLPDAAATVRRWRSHFVRAGSGDPYIVMAQSFDEVDPTKYGMDAAAGFPPHNAGWNGTQLQGTLNLFDPEYRGQVVDYDQMASRAMANKPVEFTLFPGVCPAWDNEARKPNRGFCFIGSTPQKYGRWLAEACRTSLELTRPDERIVFINAWNEWGEGAYLEPDRHFGYAYLAETARVLNSLAPLAVSGMAQQSTAHSDVPAHSGALSNERAGAIAITRTITRRAAYMADALARALRSW